MGTGRGTASRSATIDSWRSCTGPGLEKQRWLRVKEILGAALELHPSERAAYVLSECRGDAELRAEVEALLDYSDDAEGFIEQPAIAAGIELLDQRDADAMVGRTIGRYRIVELVGEGGVGTVYRAEHTDKEFGQQIAIKVLKRGMDSGAVLRRFRDERRILSRLDHPNIAKFLDGGISEDGRPYFVMEFLEGTPIHHYCRDRGLGIRERLELFLPVCAAVAYSHRNLVIHRDLKASNILVTAGGVPKLLDFGIAKLLERDTSGPSADATLPVDHMMTPDYASPEQIRGELVTTASDVYSLGVLLYELLADRRPMLLSGMTSAQMLKAIDNDPPKPSESAPPERSRHLQGDLDTIICKAMHRSPERRYASAQQLGDDIRRYLGGLPVHARPDTVAYRIRKYAERNRTMVLAICLSAIAVTGGLLTAVWQTGVAASKEAEARKRFGEIRDLAAGLLGEVDASLENLPGATVAREMLARKVLHYLDELAKDDVRDQKLQMELAAAYERLGDIMGGPKSSNLGKSAAALESYRKALAIYERQRATVESAPHRSRALSKISDVLAVVGDHAGAIAEEQKALAIREAWLRANPNETAAKRAVAGSLQELAGDYDRLGRFTDALENRRRVLFILQGIRATTTPDTSLNIALALAHKRLGRSLVRTGQIHAAMPHFNTAIEIERAELALNAVAPNRRANLAFSLQDMGLALEGSKEYARAVPYFEEALRLRTDLSKADPNDWRVASTVAASRLHLGGCLVRIGKGEGLAQIEQAVASREQLAERSPGNMGARAEVAEAYAALADAYAHLGQKARTRPLYEKALAMYDELQGKGSLSAEVGGDRERIARLLGR